MAETVFEGKSCDCCRLAVVNDDTSGCRDFSNHDHAEPAPEKLPDGAVVFDCSLSENESEETCDGCLDIPSVGPCDLCGQDDGYMELHSFSIISEES